MAISYNGLWKLLIDKGMTKVQLRDAVGMGPGERGIIETTKNNADFSRVVTVNSISL